MSVSASASAADVPIVKAAPVCMVQKTSQMHHERPTAAGASAGMHTKRV